MEGKEQSFIQKLDDIAGKILPYVEAAAAFKRGYQGGGTSRKASSRYQDMILQELERSRMRNEAAVRKAEAQTQERDQRRRTDKVVDSLRESKRITDQQYLDYYNDGIIPSIERPELVLEDLKGEGGEDKMLGASAIVRGLKAGFALDELKDAADRQGYGFGRKAEETYF
tara:strand:+ start:240 stop:749 length:510 start_codon:yes stop_codon:yes gene_type:complete